MCSMGLPDDKQILHADHLVVCAFKAEYPDRQFILAPEESEDKISILVGKDAVFRQFQALLGVSLAASRHTQS